MSRICLSHKGTYFHRFTSDNAQQGSDASQEWTSDFPDAKRQFTPGMAPVGGARHWGIAILWTGAVKLESSKWFPNDDCT
jgi:hypothetical protein